MASDAGPPGSRRDDRSLMTRLGLRRALVLRSRRPPGNGERASDNGVTPGHTPANGEGVVAATADVAGTRQPPPAGPGPRHDEPGHTRSEAVRGFAEILPTVPVDDDLLPSAAPGRPRHPNEVPQAPDDAWAEVPNSYAPPQEEAWTDEPWPEHWLEPLPEAPLIEAPGISAPRVESPVTEAPVPRPVEPCEEPSRPAAAVPAPSIPAAPPRARTARPAPAPPVAPSPVPPAPPAPPAPAPLRPRPPAPPAPEAPAPPREPPWRERIAVAHRSAAVLRRLSIRGLLARKVRLALTALAVVLGVCFVSGTYVLTDTLKRSFDRVFAQTAVGVDAVVRTKAPFGSNSNVSRVRLPAGLINQVRTADGVGAAEGVIQGPAQFVSRDGKKAIDTGGAPTIGLSWDDRDHVSPLRIDVGRPPAVGGEVAMDSATARRHGFRVGDTVRVLLNGPAERLRLVGTFCFASQCDLGGAAFAAFDVRTAQHAFNSPNAFDFIDVKAKPGVTPQRMIDSLRQALPGYDVTDASAVAKETGRQVHDAFGFLNDALLGFASIGVFVGAFIIFNTFTILVSQRTRELGLLRALGARSGQVMRSVIAEAAVVGVLASVVGLVVGIGLAIVLLRAVEHFGLHIPPGNTVLLQRTVIAAFVVGISVTVGSAVYPALRAARVPPVAAINDYGPSVSAPLLRRTIVGAVVFVIGIAILVLGLVRHYTQITSRMEVVGIGALTTFVGVAVLSPVLSRPLSRMLGWPMLGAIGVTGTLARGNAMRNPRRTAATASALTIGLSLVCLVAIFAASAKASLHKALDTGVRADYILSSQQFAGFSPAAAQQVARVPAVRSVASLRFDDAAVANNTESITGVDSGAVTDVINLGMVSGTPSLGGDDVLIHETEAKAYHVTTGQSLMIWFPRTGPQMLHVAGVYRNDHFTGGIPVKFLVSRTTFENNFGTNQQDTLVYAKANRGQKTAAKKQIEQVLTQFPNLTAKTPAEFQRQQEQTINMFLSVLIALLLLSEVIAILGIVNTLALSVFERTHELGLLRAVGMTRRQVRRMVRAESVIIAVIGGLLGLAVGTLWGWAMTRALHDQGVTHFSLPTVQLVVFLLASAVAGVVAAVLPAWRAGRLDVLEAIATE